MTTKKKADRQTVTVTLELVGMQYRVTEQTRIYIAKWMEENGPIAVKFVPEPTNEKDPNAVKVVISEGAYKDQHVGYIPRTAAQLYGPRLREGEIKIKEAHITELWTHDGEGELLVKVRAPNKKSLLTALKEIT